MYCIITAILPLALQAQVKQLPQSDTGTATDIREHLIKLALQNPDYAISNHQLAIANYQLKKAKNSVLSKMNVNFNANEYTLKLRSLPGDNNNLLFPLFNVGLSLPMDLFSTRKNEVRIARENIGITQAQRKLEFRQLKAEVLTKYEDYLMYKQKLENESKIATDVEAVFLQAEKDFADGTIKQDEYNKAYRDRTEGKIKLAESARNFNVSKIELEKIIGVSLEEALQSLGK
jgi:outer membrane protein TolC